MSEVGEQFPELTEKQQVYLHRYLVSRVLNGLMNIAEIGGVPVETYVSRWYDNKDPEIQSVLAHEEPLYVACEITKSPPGAEREFQIGERWKKYLEVRQSASREWFKLHPHVYNRSKSRFDRQASL